MATEFEEVDSISCVETDEGPERYQCNLRATYADGNPIGGFGKAEVNVDELIMKGNRAPFRFGGGDDFMQFRKMESRATCEVDRIGKPITLECELE